MNDSNEECPDCGCQLVECKEQSIDEVEDVEHTYWLCCENCEYEDVR